jgi:hypothetical protein
MAPAIMQKSSETGITYCAECRQFIAGRPWWLRITGESGGTLATGHYCQPCANKWLTAKAHNEQPGYGPSYVK